MIRRLTIAMVLAPVFMAGCATVPERQAQVTLAELRNVQPDVQEVQVEQGFEQAMEGYRRFLEETPETAMTPEAMRRLADLQIEKQFGIRDGEGTVQETALPVPSQADVPERAGTSGQPGSPDGIWESDQEFEQRTTAETAVPASPAGVETDPADALEAIALYDKLLTEYPSYENSDQVLYQKARAYDEIGRSEEAMETMELLIQANPHSGHYDEVQFRRGEFLFTRRQYRDAESAYAAIFNLGAGSSYYELALYKLGWTLYKQEFYEEALHKYMALMDYKVSVGYDFDQAATEEDERRVADTYRAISLSFSYIGPPETVAEYFAEFGNRTYEDRVYNNLGEHYLAKLRYDDAAKTYKTFMGLYPFHRAAPMFSMRVVETFTKGEFPKLVLEAKREFASDYGLHSEYWQHYEPEESPEVLAYLKTNLNDLATHYHARYQDTEDEAEKLASHREARRWYGDYLESFPTDEDTPAINYRLADLLLESGEFGEAARQYERTAYKYAGHAQSSAAGYAAVYAYREQMKVADDEQQDAVRRNTVESSLRFADAFPDHEHTAAVLGAAADDLYELEDYDSAIAASRRVIDAYPEAGETILRSAWIVVAHGSFELAEYPQAEQAYGETLARTPLDDESHEGLVDNLAASIYRQGEIANDAQDYRAAADHFLRIRSAAPTSAIRASAEYDAGAALIRLESWNEAAGVFEAFRSAYPGHELQLEATRQIAYAYREDGRLMRAADEYDRFATESVDPELRREALLVAGDLYEQSDAPGRALNIYNRYVEEYSVPVEPALETRFKIAGIHNAADDDSLYHQELAEIVRLEAEAGPDRTGRTRFLAASSALVLAEQLYGEFITVKLLQPFEASLQDKQERLDTTIAAMGALVSYEVAEVTAAATYYMAEIYFDFSRSLAESERPTDLEPVELAEYELALEEEGYPFEEKAIDLHEENLELLQAGVFNSWTAKSLDKLAELVPGRYAKNEMSSGFLARVDVYEYRSPGSEFVGPLMSGIDTTDRNETVLAARAQSGEEER
ncbi:MAG: tetratricopeptide repeat protein [Acidobacteria bacterium]|uniref:Tetratricopeptide repeat protein n=1 Tax=Candidatus Polarisedimenticola svalbardensis TaxID=2886004 RepID=A0A8J6Y313_9BACT|nr:tetratricopeptide repeat protein [Candidatus Polarisedimenticola svalbardensis]